MDEPGLNENSVLRELVLSLLDGGCAAFVETGTFKGDTAAWIAKHSKVPVFTCELNQERARTARERLRDTSIKFYEMASPRFLDAIRDRFCGIPLVYLDAHAGGKGSEFWPIADEFKHLAKDARYHEAVVVVHDFIVPCVPEFRSQHHPDGTYLGLEYIAPYLRTDYTYRFYFPIRYVPGKSGYVCIFQNVEPFGLALDRSKFKEFVLRG